MTNTEEDEWEYEYDETETEDFYIPVDLANVPETQGPIKDSARVGHPVLIKSRLRALNAGRREADNTTSNEDAPDRELAGEVQLLDLHTENPLIMYNGQLLSCHWTSTIGTDLIFAKPIEDASVVEKPLRSLPDMDLLALASAKLVARAARLRPRDDIVEELQASDITRNPESPQNTHTGHADTTEDIVVHPPPSSFLAKLNAAKAKRGDKTQLVLSKSVNGSRLVADQKDMQPSGEDDGGEDTIMDET